MLRPRFDEMALTRAMTPEMNTVGLGGLEDKRGKGDLVDQLATGMRDGGLDGLVLGECDHG